MIHHHLKLAIRNIQRKGLFSVLNIVGLSVGLASFLVIGLYVFQESTFERGFSKADRTYRIYTKFLNASLMATSSVNLADELAKQPEVEEATSLMRVPNSQVLSVGDVVFQPNNYFEVDESFFHVFDFDLLYGNRETALNNPNSLILTEEEAQRLFGRTDVVGETVEIKDDQVLITGIIKASLYKSHLNFNGLWSKPESPYKLSAWSGVNAYTYAVLGQNVKPEQLQKRFDEINEDFIFPGFQSSMSFAADYTFQDWTKDSNIELFAQPITEIHLESELSRELETGGEKSTVLAFAIIAIFILIISCANFINLSTAKASDRAKEIGMKKVMGSSRLVLVTQLLVESLLITLFAGVLAFGFAELALKLVDYFFDGFISISLVQTPQVLFFLLLLLVLIGILSGLYPAIYLSSFKVTALLKGQKVKGFKGASSSNVFRNALVVIQFSLSAILIICAVFMSKQLKYISKIDLGFDEENVLVLPKASLLTSQFEAFRTEIERMAIVENTSSLSSLPGEENNGFKIEMETASGETVYTNEFYGDSEIFDVLGIELLYGRLFSDNVESNIKSVLINETAASLIGNGNVLGQTLDGDEVIGVVKDFHFQSLREQISPVIFKWRPRFTQLAIKMPINQENIERIEAKWQEFSNLPINHYFLEDNYDAIIDKEYKVGDAFSMFTAVAIFISCLGMFGLTVFAADQRSKEFGIRKVLGAQVADLIKLLMNNFLKLALLALLIAVPCSIWGINQWITDFAYRIEVSALIFIIGGLLVFAMVFLTVFHQSYKVAVKNPVDSLKSE